MNRSQDPHRWLQKKSQKQTPDYPLATIAFFGPDNLLATKAVVAILMSEQDTVPAAVKKWINNNGDARQDPAIRAEMMEFLTEFPVRKVVFPDQIQGCPHEEGVDYPAGTTCPYCPYWKKTK